MEHILQHIHTSVPKQHGYHQTPLIWNYRRRKIGTCSGWSNKVIHTNIHYWYPDTVFRISCLEQCEKLKLNPVTYQKKKVNRKKYADIDGIVLKTKMDQSTTKWKTVTLSFFPSLETFNEWIKLQLKHLPCHYNIIFLKNIIKDNTGVWRREESIVNFVYCNFAAQIFHWNKKCF